MGSVLFANAFTDLTAWLSDFSANWWFLAIILVIALLDSVVPIVPSETLVIIGGVAAGQGDQRLLLVIAAGAIGAFLGDNTAYELGDRMSGFIQRHADRRPKWQARLGWASDQIRRVPVGGGPDVAVGASPGRPRRSSARARPSSRPPTSTSRGSTRMPRGSGSSRRA